MEKSTKTQEELAKFNQETRDSVRGKNNYAPGEVSAVGAYDYDAETLSASDVMPEAID
jgi:hypothetical protein